MNEVTILLAEDDAEQEAAVRRALQLIDSSWCVEVVRDGVEVLDYLLVMGRHADRDPQRDPRLILLDLKMPTMDGLQVWQVLRRVRGGQRSRLPPIVMLTSSPAEAEIVSHHTSEPFTSIDKAVEFDELVAQLRRTTLHWLTWIEAPPRKPIAPSAASS